MLKYPQEDSLIEKEFKTPIYNAQRQKLEYK